METANQSLKDNTFKQITFRSRYSIVLLLIMMATLITLIIAVLSEPKALIGVIIALPIILMVLGFSYVITGDILVFKTWGIKSGSVSIKSILKVERSYLALSSNAGSFKRLYLTVKEESKYPFILISPVREDEFIEHLKSINPQIEVKVDNKSSKFRFWDWDL